MENFVRGNFKRRGLYLRQKQICKHSPKGASYISTEIKAHPPKFRAAWGKR